MRIPPLALAMLAAGAAALTVAAQEPPAPSTTTTAVAEGYVWGDACKSCHAAIHEAWSHTKHARTIGRLSHAEQETPCVGCHVTGPKQAIVVDDKVVNANVQCEACHGPGKAHVEAALAGNAAPAGVVRSPGQRLCETCHNDRSPHYRGFFYSALKGLVHKTK